MKTKSDPSSVIASPEGAKQSGLKSRLLRRPYGAPRNDGKRFLIKLVLLCASAFIFIASAALISINAKYPWFWNVLGDQMRVSEPISIKPKHVMFTFVDHFEPHEEETLTRWIKAYPNMASHHRDSDGRFPQHTWFWYFSKSGPAEKQIFLNRLSHLAYEGFGEIELHMHHFKDTEESFLKLMNEALKQSRQNGAMITAETKPRTAFGFIHGLWSLDNSRGSGACGINNELILLRELGAYADFTHPSWGVMHPKMVNRIYYATDNPEKPKSYDTGKIMEVNKPGLGDLLIFEGPSTFEWKGLKPSYDEGDVTVEDAPLPKRIDRWVKTGIHVNGRPEWVFIKVHTHGAVFKDYEAVLGKLRDEMHSYLESRYNDGKNFALHYVTAREAYNIAKAAESGKSGNPNEYRDFVIPPYVNRTFLASAPFETLSFDTGKIVVRFLERPGTNVKIRLRGHGVRMSGDAAVVSEELLEHETVMHLLIQEDGLVGVTFHGLRVGATRRVAPTSEEQRP